MAYQGQTMAGKKGTSDNEELTALPGVGAATAKKLQAAGLTTAAKIAKAERLVSKRLD